MRAARARMLRDGEFFLQATSSIPLAAIVDGRQRFVIGEIGLWRVALALALYVLFVWWHPWLFGVSPLG